MVQFILNNKEITTRVPSGMTVLDFVRYEKQLTGTKIGCREGDCGACTVLIGELKDNKLRYSSATSCLLPVGNVANKHVVTVEGVNVEGLNAVQQAFAEEGATQCGFCTPGFIVALTGTALQEVLPENDGYTDAMNGNICRCTGYKSIERAAAKVSRILAGRGDDDAIAYAVRQNFIPEYFRTIKERLISFTTAQASVPDTGAPYFVGGGTDLYVQKHDTIADEIITHLSMDQNLRGIRQSENMCEVGGSSTVTDIAESNVFRKYFPSLQKIIKLISSTPIRNMATVAGNFANASPIGDLSILFLALDSQLLLISPNGKRKMSLKDFFIDYKIVGKNPDEIIEKISFPILTETHYFNFEKVSKRTHLDIASVNSAISLVVHGQEIVQANLSAGGVAPVPKFLEAASSYLRGKKLSASLILETIEIVQSEISPISDARGTEEYKRLLLSQLIKAHFITLFPDLPVLKLLSTK